MFLRRVLGAVGIIVASLGLVGCTPGGPSAPSASGTPSTPVAAVATGLVVSLDKISVVNRDGSTGASAEFSSGSATLALLSGALGSTPAAVHDDTYGSTRYDWGAVSLVVSDASGSALVSISAPELGGLTLRTVDGIHVGSTLADLQAVASPGTQYPTSGTPTMLGLQARAHPGTDSLTYPGRGGLDFIAADVKGGAVVRFTVPSGDWQDL